MLSARIFTERILFFLSLRMQVITTKTFQNPSSEALEVGFTGHSSQWVHMGKCMLYIFF